MRRGGERQRRATDRAGRVRRPAGEERGDLFLATGAVDESHCGDYLAFAASCTQTDRLYEAKRQILEGMGMSADGQTFPVFADRMPMQLLAYMRFARVQDPGSP